MLMGYLLENKSLIIETNTKNAELNELNYVAWMKLNPELHKKFKETLSSEENQPILSLPDQMQASEIQIKKATHFFIEDELGIFQERCKFEEFNMMMTLNDPLPFESQLNKIVDLCFQVDKEVESIQLNNVYQLLQGIQVSIKLQKRDNESRYEHVLKVGKELFAKVRENAINMD